MGFRAQGCDKQINNNVSQLITYTKEFNLTISIPFAVPDNLSVSSRTDG